MAHGCSNSVPVQSRLPGSGKPDSPTDLTPDISTISASYSDSTPDSPRPEPDQQTQKPYEETIKQPRLLTHLPIELLKLITSPSNLSNLDLRSLKMTTRGLHYAELPTNPLSRWEFILFHKRLEATIPSPRHLLAQNLLCSKCLRILPKSAFQDAHAHRRVQSNVPRSCIKCRIRRGYFDRRRFRFGSKMCFVCLRCSKVKPEIEMAEVDLDQAAEDVHVDCIPHFWWLRFRRGRRCCMECWTRIKRRAALVKKMMEKRIMTKNTRQVKMV